MGGLLILGADGNGKVIADIAAEISKWDYIAFLDDNITYDTLTYPVIGKCGDFMRFKDDFYDAFVAIEDKTSRMQWIDKLSVNKFNLPALIHPRAFVSKFSIIQKGSSIMAGTVINPNVHIGRGCFLGANISIDHDCVIEDGVVIEAGTTILDSAVIGKGARICLGSNICSHIEVGKMALVREGSTVCFNVPDNETVFGNPAKLQIKERKTINLQEELKTRKLS